MTKYVLPSGYGIGLKADRFSARCINDLSLCTSLMREGLHKLWADCPPTSMRLFNLDVDLIRMKENINSWIIHEYHCAFIWAGLVSDRLMH